MSFHLGKEQSISVLPQKKVLLSQREYAQAHNFELAYYSIYNMYELLNNTSGSR